MSSAQIAKDSRRTAMRSGRNYARNLASRVAGSGCGSLYPRSIIELSERIADHSRNSHYGRVPAAVLRKFAAGIPPAELCMDDPARFPWPAPVRTRPAPARAEAV